MGIMVEVSAGDVIILPAGTGHCNVKSSKDYRYIGVYPKVCSLYYVILLLESKPIMLGWADIGRERRSGGMS